MRYSSYVRPNAGYSRGYIPECRNLREKAKAPNTPPRPSLREAEILLNTFGEGEDPHFLGLAKPVQSRTSCRQSQSSFCAEDYRSLGVNRTIPYPVPLRPRTIVDVVLSTTLFSSGLQLSMVCKVR